MALDTFVPSQIVDRGFIIAHNNGLYESGPASTRFPSSVIVTSTAFLRFILHVEREELKHATAILSKEKSPFYRNIDIHSFSLPIHASDIWKKYAKGIDSLYFSATDSEQKLVRDRLEAMLIA